MKRFLLAVAIVGSFVPLSANAVTLRGGGVGSCGTWLEHRADENRRPIPAALMGQWALGYLSAQALASNKDVLKIADADAVYFWLDGYCRSHPLLPFTDALDAMAFTVL